MHYFSSTAIRAASYNAGSRKLTLWFTDEGEAHDYYQVPEPVFTGLLYAPSKGSYFDQHIRDQYCT
jgi:hypothetical protein